MKTQIAKISYTSILKTLTKKKKPKESSSKEQEDSTEHQSRNVINSTELETRKICSSDLTGIEFVKMKKKRDQEFKNLNTYLTEIINKSADKSKLTAKNKVEYEAECNTSRHEKFFRRSKTEIDVRSSAQSERHLKARVGSTVRSKSSHPPNTKSHELLPSVSQNTKKKSYNVEEARKFLREQKRRRHSQQANSPLKVKSEKNTLEKEQIKKRLEELRKNSRAIIIKNVNKKKNAPIAQSSQNVALGEGKAKEIKADPDLCKQIDLKENNCGEALRDLKVNTDLKKRKTVTMEICPSTTNANVIKHVGVSIIIYDSLLFYTLVNKMQYQNEK